MIPLERYFDLTQVPFRHIFAEARTVFDFKNCAEAFFQNSARRAIKGDVHPSAIIDGAVIVEQGAKIGPHVLIEGPVWICAGAIIRHAAYIRDNSIIGPATQIGHATEIARSVFLARARALHFAFVGDSFIGNNVNIGSSCVFANLRIDRPVLEPAVEEIRVKIGGRYVNTGYTKFGAVVGDGARIAALVSIGPGTLLDKQAVVYPRAQMREDSLRQSRAS